MAENLTMCPCCGGDRRLGAHCPNSKACTWRTCTNPGCRVTIDVRTARHTHVGTADGCRLCATTPKP